MADIMVVDDSVVQRRVLRSNLESWGHTVVAEAGSGDEALALYDEFRPPMVTLDISMQGMDGLECLRQLHEKNPDIKVVMITALGTGDRVRQAKEYGCVGFVVKPINWETLRDVVDQNV